MQNLVASWRVLRHRKVSPSIYFHGHDRRLLAVWRHEIAQEESPYYADEEFIASNTFFYSIAERARELSSVDAVRGISGVDDHLHRRNFSRTCSMCKSDVKVQSRGRNIQSISYLGECGLVAIEKDHVRHL